MQISYKSSNLKVNLGYSLCISYPSQHLPTQRPFFLNPLRSLPAFGALPPASVLRWGCWPGDEGISQILEGHMGRREADA